MNLCAACLDTAINRTPLIEIVSDDDLRNPSYLKDVRDFTAGLAITPERWPDFLMDLYRDFRGYICHEEGHIISLNTEHLETYPEWYRDWTNTPVSPGVMPRLRKESKARVRVLATILKTAFPVEAASWGLAPANDNTPGSRVCLVK